MRKLDVIGKTFGDLTVLRDLQPIRDKTCTRRVVECRCSCGEVLPLVLYYVTSGKKTNCGKCRREEGFNSFAGEKGKIYGRLTVLSLNLEKSVEMQAAHVDVVCTCGVSKVVGLDSLKRGLTVSCGCKTRECAVLLGKSRRTHGLSKTVEYETWVRMKGRCYNLLNQDYPQYGGKGIGVCASWRESFEAFLADMGERPEGMELDRKDPSKDYSPENCRWATEQVQAWNRGLMCTNTSGKDGVRLTKYGRWEARISKDGKEMYLGTFNTIEDAVAAREAAEVRLYGEVKNPFKNIRAEEDIS